MDRRPRAVHASQPTKRFLTAKLANEAMEMVETMKDDERRLTQRALTHVKDASAAASIRIIIRSLGQISRYCRIIDEVTINRIMEKPSEICEYGSVW